MILRDTEEKKMANKEIYCTLWMKKEVEIDGKKLSLLGENLIRQISKVMKITTTDKDLVDHVKQSSYNTEYQPIFSDSSLVSIPEETKFEPQEKGKQDLIACAKYLFYEAKASKSELKTLEKIIKQFKK